MNHILHLVAELVLRETGIRIQAAQYPALRSALARALPNGDPADFMRIAGDPVEGPRAIARLVDEVTIKETSFLRDRRQLDAIDWRTLQEHARGRGIVGDPDLVRRLRDRRGGVATLALLAWEAFAPATPPVRILATDVSNAALDAARAGRYRERSLRAVAPSLRELYFEHDEDALVAGERVRSIVHFAQHNLVTGSMPPLGETAFDLIVCRNVLIYFDGVTVDRVIDGFESALRPEGSLVLGSADTLCGTARNLAKLNSARAPQKEQPARLPLRKPLGRTETAASSGPTDPFESETRFLRAIAELEGGEALAAAASLRHVLYLDPTFGLAAFALGRAHEASGDASAARRAYEQALRTIDMTDERHDHLLEQVELVDVATACRARLATL